MMLIYDDIFKKISEYQTDNEKIQLSMASHRTDKLKHIFIYRNKIKINLIYRLPYFDNFENVEIFDDNYRTLPTMSKYVHYFATSRFIPSNVTHLTFSDNFDEPVNDIIPLKVTHLTFGRYFGEFNNRPINKLPPAITHLTFGRYFNSPVELHHNITHLTFGACFDRLIELTSSITHLTLGLWFDKPDIVFPQSLTHLIYFEGFDKVKTFNQKISDNVIIIKKSII
uniref:Uncharacterized protein n=1 Tax=viral metagenome TaxID=1070528 RepID=A0A6C0C8N3_9ZZZZ